MLCLFFRVDAQSQTSNIKPLKIGDTIPEAVWNIPLQVVNHPEGKKTITLNDYRGKLIILDFWATWCSPCIASLDKLAPVYHENLEDLMLIPIASHDVSRKKIETLMKKQKWGVLSVFDEKQFLFKKVFRPANLGIPHLVWIKDSKIIAIPNTAYVTKDNILKAIKGVSLNMVMDTTIIPVLDFSKALFVQGNGKTDLYYRKPPYSVISRYLPGHGTGSPTVFLRSSDTTILAAINRHIEDLFFDAYKPSIFPGLNKSNGIAWLVSDSLKSRFFNGPKYDKTHQLENELKRNQWLKQNTYGYNLRFPEDIDLKEAHYFMQQDLSRFFRAYLNLQLKVEYSPLPYKYAILRLIGSKQQSIDALKHENRRTKVYQDKNTDYYVNQHYKQRFLSVVSNAIPDLTIKSVIDSTGIPSNLRVDFKFSKRITEDPVLLDKELKNYGIELVIKKNNVPILFVREEKESRNVKIQQHP